MEMDTYKEMETEGDEYLWRWTPLKVDSRHVWRYLPMEVDSYEDGHLWRWIPMEKDTYRNGHLWRWIPVEIDTHGELEIDIYGEGYL